MFLAKERELFVLFHTDPGRLQHMVDGLAARARAQHMQQQQQQDF